MNGHGPKLGELITTNEERDAIHIAVAPVEAGEKMYPGNWVEWETEGNLKRVVATNATRGIGIVDPFLPAGVPVAEGQHFWLYVKPNTITGLRHQWEHPAFDDQRGIAEFWLRDFCHRYEMDYNDMLSQVRNMGEQFRFGEDINYPDDEAVEGFRRYVKIMTGVTLGPDISFSCAC
jgi:hypothetical protein